MNIAKIRITIFTVKNVKKFMILMLNVILQREMKSTALLSMKSMAILKALVLIVQKNKMKFIS